MKGHCEHPGCYPDGPCAQGEITKSQCKHFIAAAGPGTITDTEGSEQLVPWNGHLLGTDLAVIAARGRPIIVGLVGPHEAGKTTFLAVLYWSLLLGKRIAGMRFAGSYTLAAWEELAAWTRAGVDRPGRFPPRTSSSSIVSAGLLHVALRAEDRPVTDVLFTDAPGEWFQHWAINADSAAAAGARWVARAADVFLVFADSMRLGGADRGVARGDTILMIERLSSVTRRRATALVWSKADLDVPASIRDAVAQSATRLLPGSTEWRTSYKDAESVVRAVSSIVAAGFAAPTATPIIEPRVAARPFFGLRDS